MSSTTDCLLEVMIKIFAKVLTSGNDIPKYSYFLNALSSISSRTEGWSVCKNSSGCRRAVVFLTLLRKFSLWSPRCVNSSRKLKHLRFLSGQFTCTVAVCWHKSCLVICSWNLYNIAVISVVHLISCTGEFDFGLFAIVQCSSLLFIGPWLFVVQPGKVSLVLPSSPKKAKEKDRFPNTKVLPFTLNCSGSWACVMKRSGRKHLQMEVRESSLLHCHGFLCIRDGQSHWELSPLISKQNIPCHQPLQTWHVLLKAGILYHINLPGKWASPFPNISFLSFSTYLGVY